MRSLLLVTVVVGCGGSTATTKSSSPGARTSSAPSSSAVALPQIEKAAAAAQLAVAERGVALPSQPRAHVEVAGKTAVFMIAGKAPLELTADTDEDELVRSVQSQLPAAPPCARGKEPTAAVKQLVARVEQPVAGDAIVVVDGSKPSSGLIAIMAVLAYPTTIAVRDAKGGALRVLPIRFCPGYTDAPKTLPSAIEVATTGMGIVTVPSSGFVRDRVEFLRPSTPAPEIAASMRRTGIAPEAQIETVRISTHAGVTVSAFVTQLEAALAVDPRDVAIVIERYEPDLLTVRFHVTGGFPVTKARSALYARENQVLECYVRAAFGDPTLVQRFPLKASVSATGAVQVVVPDGASELVKCVAAALTGACIYNVKSRGVLELEVELGRMNPRDVPPQGPMPSLHGTGP